MKRIKLSVIYYSFTGNVHMLAAGAAESAEKAGAEVRMRRIAEITPMPSELSERSHWAEHAAATDDVPLATLDDLDWPDAILIGSPVRFGLPAPALMHFIDTTAQLSITGRLTNKTVSVFTSACAPHGGTVSTILALHNAVSHWGSIIVPAGSADPVLYQPDNGSPYGTSHVSHNKFGNVTEDQFAAMDFQTRRTVEVASALVGGLSRRGQT
jgi:NAD(P)H dehydrogenase (quinone)